METLKEVASDVLVFIFSFVVASGISCSPKVVTCGGVQAPVESVSR